MMMSTLLAMERDLNWDLAFDEISIWGLAGPLFHKLSNYFFFLMVLTTIVDGVRILLAPRGVATRGSEASNA